MATLVSLNVGLPKDVAWKGRTVHTGAWKAPVDGPRMVRRYNVDGDGQGDLGGHGGENRAVLVYQVDSYRYWAAEFGRDDLSPGHFGENFTVDGLPDDEVCVGDRYRIGDAVFEVTQPRVTCYRVGMRMGVPNMASLLVAHHRARLLSPGVGRGRGGGRPGNREGRLGPRSGDRRGSRRAALPSRAFARCPRARTADPRPQPGMEDLAGEPGKAGRRSGGSFGQHRIDLCGDQSAARVDRLSAVGGHRAPRRERSRPVAVAGGPRRAAAPGMAAGSIDHGATAARRRPDRRHPQLLAVERAGLRCLPHRRQAGAERPRQRIPPRPGRARRRARRRGAAGHVLPRRRRPPGGPAVRRGRHHPGAVDVARARGVGFAARDLVVARRPQRLGASVRRREPRAPEPVAQQPFPRLLQPSVRVGRGRRALHGDGTTVGGGVRCARAAAGRRGLPVRSGRLHVHA